MTERPDIKMAIADHPRIVGGVLAILLALMIGQGIIDHRREVAEASQKQRAEDLAKQKGRAVEAKVDKDDKALNAVCGPGGPGWKGKWDDACAKPLADAGNAAAQELLGSHLFGTGKYDSAIPWLEKSANQGDARSMYLVGSIYATRSGSRADIENAMHWLHAAADLGDSQAMWFLGDIYRVGEITPQDFVEARKWFTKAAEAGNAESAAYLGRMDKDDGDLVGAYKWFNISCAGYRLIGAVVCSERDEVAARLNPADVKKAQALASEWAKQFGK